MPSIIETLAKKQLIKDSPSFLVRLLYEVEILEEHDIDLQRHHEHMKAIRRGEVSQEDISQWANSKEKQLEVLYHKSTLPQIHFTTLTR